MIIMMIIKWNTSEIRVWLANIKPLTLFWLSIKGLLLLMAT